MKTFALLTAISVAFSIQARPVTVKSTNAHGTGACANVAFRPPAVPLVSVEPHFSVWSPSDRLYDADTIHWAGAKQPLSILLEADGTTYRLCGRGRGKLLELPVLPQTSCRVGATMTSYSFSDGKGLSAEIDFTTPRMTDDLEVFSRPVTYVTVRVKGAEKATVKASITAAWATNDDKAKMLWTTNTVAGVQDISVGRTEQRMFSVRGDLKRADWGRVHLAGPIAENRNTTRFLLAYDNVKSVRFSGSELVDWWNRRGKGFDVMFAEAVRDAESIEKKCREFDAEFRRDMEKLGGIKYADMAELAWRQSFSACKFVANTDGEPFLLSAENGSGGMIGTTDVFYPQFPHLLMTSLKLAKASLAPTCIYAASANWPYSYAPHDLGLFPVAEGQYYGMKKGQSVGGGDDDTYRMPVEECGNMLILLAAVADAEGNARFAGRWWGEVTKWAEYLTKFGYDPGNQLCTDDFAGHLAHNANLSLKSIVALACYSKMAAMRGDSEVAARYRTLAEGMVPKWMSAAAGGAHGGTRIAFDRPGTWSLKYNLVWDRVLGLGLFPPEVAEREMCTYRAVEGLYGVPLDCRKTYTKADWLVWAGSLTGKREDLEFMCAGPHRFLNETPDRVAFSDWYMTDSRIHRSFVARSVVGGVFMPVLFDRGLVGKYRKVDYEKGDAAAVRVEAMEDGAWKSSRWISVKNAPVEVNRKSQRAASGTSVFLREVSNAKKVVSAKWMTTGLGVYEIYINGRRVGEDILKPGFTHVCRVRRSFTYDVTKMMDTAAGAKNVLSAEVSAGWWRDKIVGYTGKKSAFRAVLELVYEDGTKEFAGTDENTWTGVVGGPVTHAGIFDGEEYDARVAPVSLKPGKTPYGCEENREFTGKYRVILPSEGGEVCSREDIALRPVDAYVWKGIEGRDESKRIFGTVKKLRKIDFASGGAVIEPGETLVADFGQNAAAVPVFEFAADEGAVLTCLPAEMLNDGNGERSRGNDGPSGSVYRENLRMPDQGMRLVYTFGSSPAETFVTYRPRFTFFGYRYISVSATKRVVIKSVVSIPVTSITKDMEIGRIKTGNAAVNRLVANVYWGQLSNYLSVPTDCPQRNERLGWTADTQVFAEAGTFNADTRGFFRKWMRDLGDSQDPRGGFPGVAPFAQYGNEPMRFCWADAGVIVPYQVWKQFGDVRILKENWKVMEKYVAHVDETRHDHDATKAENGGYQWADWLSFEDLESWSEKAWKDKKLRPEAKRYWNYLGACYWMWDALMMKDMAAAIGKDAHRYAKMADNAKVYLKENFFAEDGLLIEPFRNMQTPILFALKLGLLEGEKKIQTVAALRRNFAESGDCLQTGFLGTSILMDTLSANGMSDVAYTLLLQRKNPSWLYSVDQGATTIWERWDSYTKERGFGPVAMNSFNHYAYGAVLAWIYKIAAGIASDPENPGFKTVVMAPVPDRRLGFVEAEYKSAAGVIKSDWRYEGDKWIWRFTVPEGATAKVKAPGDAEFSRYASGTYEIVR